MTQTPPDPNKLYDVNSVVSYIEGMLNLARGQAGSGDDAWMPETPQVEAPTAKPKTTAKAGMSAGTPGHIGDFGVSQGFGGSHDGIDIEAPVGTRLVSPMGGTVTHAGNDDPGGYGSWVQITLEDGSVIEYGHLSGVNVEQGQSVSAGELIGLSGGMAGEEGSGSSTGPHLHFRVHQNGTGVDPAGLLASGWNIFGG